MTCAHPRTHLHTFSLLLSFSFFLFFFSPSFLFAALDDHNCPTMRQLSDAIESIQSWLSADSANVAVIHCKGGKGRTGCLVSAYLVYAGTYTFRRAPKTSVTLILTIMTSTTLMATLLSDV